MRAHLKLLRRCDAATQALQHAAPQSSLARCFAFYVPLRGRRVDGYIQTHASTDDPSLLLLSTRHCFAPPPNRCYRVLFPPRYVTSQPIPTCVRKKSHHQERARFGLVELSWRFGFSRGDNDTTQTTTPPRQVSQPKVAGDDQPCDRQASSCDTTRHRHRHVLCARHHHHHLAAGPIKPAAVSLTAHRNGDQIRLGIISAASLLAPALLLISSLHLYRASSPLNPPSSCVSTRYSVSPLPTLTTPSRRRLATTRQRPPSSRVRLRRTLTPGGRGAVTPTRSPTPTPAERVRACWDTR